MYQSEPSGSGEPPWDGRLQAGERGPSGTWRKHASPWATEVFRFVGFECAYLKEHDCLLTWTGETPETSVFPIKAKGLASGSTLAPQSSKEAEGRPVSIHCKELESLAQASGLDWRSLQSGEMDTALCGGEISAASWKTPLCLTRFYLLNFFCDNKFTIYGVVFFSHFFMNLQAQGMLKNKSQTKHSSGVTAKLLLLVFGS